MRLIFSTQLSSLALNTQMNIAGANDRLLSFWELRNRNYEDIVAFVENGNADRKSRCYNTKHEEKRRKNALARRVADYERMEAAGEDFA